MLKNINNNLILYFLPFILGIASSFSLPPYNFFIINFITFPTLFIFFVLNYKKSKFFSFFIGWLFGFGYFMSNLYWITNSLKFDEIFLFLIPFTFFLIPAFFGIFYGLVTYLTSFFKLENNFSSLLIFSSMFAFIEFIRSFILGGFPWNLIVYSLTDYINFIQILSFIGTYSLNLLSITFFTIPVVFFFNEKLLNKLLICFITLTLFILNIYFGKSVINEFDKKNFSKLTAKIKIISPKITIDRFFQNEDPYLIVQDLIELSNPIDEEETLFIYPEGILTNIYLNDLALYKKIFQENFSKNHKIIMGINSLRNEKIYNSLVLLDNELNILDQYNKNKLVPFGEYLPFENIFSKFGLKKITQGYQSFSADDIRDVFEVDDIRFLPLICYEIIYSGNLNKKKKNFNFIVNISEDGWFGIKVGPRQHFSHSIFRSIEEGKNLVRSANNGISAFIDPTGKVRGMIESTDSGVLQISSFKQTTDTVFSKHGNKIFFYFLLFYISLIFFLKRKGR